MISLMVMAATTSVSAYLIRPALDDVFIKQDQQMLILIPIAVMILYLVKGIATYTQEYLMRYVGQVIIRRLRDKLYAHIQDLPLAYFQNERTGVLMSRITNDVKVVKAMVTTAVTGSVKDLFTIIGLIGVIFYQIWDLALYAIIVLPVAFFPIVIFGKRIRHVSTGCQEAMAEMSAFLHETFSGNKIVKAFGMEAYEKKRFAERNADYFNLELKEAFIKSLSSPVMEILGGIGIAFIIWYGGSRVINGDYTAGTFISFLAAVIMLYDPVKKISRLNNSIQEGLAATDRIFDVIEQESDIKEHSHPVVIEHTSHRVVFEHVYFRYGDTPVLKDINLAVQPGEIIALVGISGGGKTSLVNLIPRFYDVWQGRVCIDDIDVRKASIASLRRQIAIVTQEPILFHGSIRSNIAYGNPEATDEQIREAAAAAYALDFIERLPDRFETNIGELGTRLSGGERQRMCIARALLKDAPILILDEATSSLDTESETVVQKALENLMKGRTTFVIAHRLTTIANAHRIIVLADGEVVEEGNHQSLLSQEGEYAKLYYQQFNNDDMTRQGAYSPGAITMDSP
jgi:subfamily B ATP-binding cassette protein MsbA